MIAKILLNNHRKRWNLVFALLLVFFHHSYAQNEPGIKKIRIDPNAAMGGTVSQYIDQVQFVTFESGPQNAFGNIDQLEITDKYYIILDNDTQSILIFNKKGQFHAKIDGKKINPQQPIFFSFKFDRSTNLIKINFLSGEFIFDLNGKLIFHYKKEPDQYLGVEATLGGKFSAYYFYAPQMPSFKKDSSAYELTVVQDGRQIKKYLPYRLNVMYNDSRGSQSHMDFWADPTTADSVVYYTREYDYDIYKLSPHTFYAAYRFIFPIQLSLPPNFRTDTTFNGKRQKFIKLNQQAIYKISNFFKSDDNLTFRAINYDFLNLSYIYSNKSKSLICINKIVSDASSYFLPITDAEVGGADFINRGILQFDGNSFYSSYSSLVLFHQMEATKNKHPQYPPLLLKYFSNKKNLKGNPVLVQLKFKTEL